MTKFKFRKERVKCRAACFLTALFPFFLAAQKDTIVLNNTEVFQNGPIFLNHGGFNPAEDTLFLRSDSSLFTGGLHMIYYDRSCNNPLKPISMETWHSVREGVPTLVHSIGYFSRCADPEFQIISYESFFSDTSVRTTSYKTNGKPWCIENSYTDSSGSIFSDKKLLNSEGTLINDIHRLNDYLHGVTQLIVSNGDTLNLQYHISSLTDVLNKNARFLSEKGKWITKEAFLTPDKKGKHCWSYAVIKHKRKPLLVVYRTNPDGECACNVFRENYCIPGTGNKSSFRRKLLIEHVYPYSDGYLSDSYEGIFRRQEKVLRRYCDSVQSTNTINLLFGTDSIYRIYMKAPRLEQHAINDVEFHYNGKYAYDEKGAIVLLGDHPFESGTLRMKEIPQKESVYTLGFTVRLKEELQWITKKNVYLNCDGGCTYEL